MADYTPKPDKISGYPAGNLHHLFRKKLSKSFCEIVLIMMKPAVEFLRNNNLITAAKEGLGLPVQIYTPCYGCGAMLKYNQPKYNLQRETWKFVVDANGFYLGQMIDCWALIVEQKSLNLLIQPVD